MADGLNSCGWEKASAWCWRRNTSAGGEREWGRVWCGGVGWGVVWWGEEAIIILVWCGFCVSWRF